MSETERSEEDRVAEALLARMGERDGEYAPSRYDVDALLAGLDDWLDAQAGEEAPPVCPEGWVMDPKGRMVRETMVREEDRLEDQAVRIILAFGLDLAKQVQRFRRHSAADLAALHAVLAAEYTPRRVGQRGNVSYTSLDGRLRVLVQAQDQIAFGPEIQVAREIIDGLIGRWGAEVRPEVQALIAHAWPVDRPGQIHRESVLRLLRLDIDDDEWRAAQRAIRDSIRITGSKRYLRLQYRPTTEHGWRSIPIDLAAEWEG